MAYILSAVISEPHGRPPARAISVRVEHADLRVAVLDDTGTDHVEAPTQRPAPAGRTWIIDLDRPAQGDEEAHASLRAALAALGWDVW